VLTDRRKFLSLISMLALGIPGKVSAMRFDEDHQPIEELSDKQYPLYVFSKVLQWADLDQLPSVVKKMGYDGIDLTVRNGGHIEPKDAKKLLPQFVARCKFTWNTRLEALRLEIESPVYQCKI
jgi:hypothetical protein